MQDGHAPVNRTRLHPKNKKGHLYGVTFLVVLARPARFERATAWFVARYSIQLSYGRCEVAYYREEAIDSQGLAQCGLHRV